MSLLDDVELDEDNDLPEEGSDPDPESAHRVPAPAAELVFHGPGLKGGTCTSSKFKSDSGVCSSLWCKELSSCWQFCKGSLALAPWRRSVLVPYLGELRQCI